MDKQATADAKRCGRTIQPAPPAAVAYYQHGIHPGGKSEQGYSDKAGDEGVWVHDEYVVLQENQLSFFYSSFHSFIFTENEYYFSLCLLDVTLLLIPYL